MFQLWHGNESTHGMQISNPRPEDPQSETRSSKVAWDCRKSLIQALPTCWQHQVPEDDLGNASQTTSVNSFYSFLEHVARLHIAYSRLVPLETRQDAVLRPVVRHRGSRRNCRIPAHIEIRHSRCVCSIQHSTWRYVEIISPSWPVKLRRDIRRTLARMSILSFKDR